MMRRQNRRARLRLLTNQTPQQNTQQCHTPQQTQITPLNQTVNQQQIQQQNQTVQQTPYALNQMGRYTPYRRRRNRQNEWYCNEHVEDRTCYICYTDILKGEYTNVCLTYEYKFHKACI